MEKTYLTSRNKNNMNGKLLWDGKCFSLELGEYESSKYYRCSFCKREFRSAQALGGHMNVHRKDRARLKFLSSSCLLQQQPHNPNPNPNSSAVNYSHHNSLLSPSPSVLSLLPSHEENYLRKPLIPQLGDLPKEKTIFMTPNFLEVEKLKSHAPNYELEGFGDCTTGRLADDWFKDSEEVLDLELRLGYF